MRKLRITNVDMNGFLGRDRHPQPSDVGLVVTPIKVEAFYYTETGNEQCVEDMLTPGGDVGSVPVPILRIFARTGPQHETVTDDVMWFYTCVTENGRVLELIDFEVEEA